MTRNLSISQEIDVCIDWKKLAKDLKKKFDIDVSEEDIEAFCCDNEIKYLTVSEYEQNIDETHTNYLTGDEEIIEE